MKKQTGSTRTGGRSGPGGRTGGRAGGRKEGGKFQGRSKRFGDKPRFLFRKKHCRFCGGKQKDIDYKDAIFLQKFITERGKILPSRISGNCAYHQRRITRAIKQARHIALLSYAAK